MKEILKSDLPLKYQNFWYNIGVEVQKQINGVVQVFVTPTGLIEIKVFIEKFNYGIHFSFQYKVIYEDVLQDILDDIKNKVYKEVFKRS